MFTVFPVVSGATLLCVAMKPNLALLACPVLEGNALGVALFSLLGVMGHARLLKLPGMDLMGLTALLGWLGIAYCSSNRPARSEEMTPPSRD